MVYEEISIHNVQEAKAKLTEVNKANIKAWINALRSGVYKQGYGCLTRTYGSFGRVYCVVGVALHIFGIHMNNGQALVGPSLAEILGIRFQIMDSFYFPVIDECGQVRAISGLNDGGEHDFDKLASLIEKTWLSR